MRGDSPSNAEAITAGLDAWSIVETRYHSAGFVEMDATLDMLTWLRPALVSLASIHPAAPIGDGHTGIIVDARGLSHTPCFSPTLNTPDGTTIARAQYVAGEVLRSRAPVTYVTDPDTPIVASAAGDNPLMLRAASASGPTLVLDAPSNETLQTLGEGHWRPLVANGRVVIVVEP